MIRLTLGLDDNGCEGVYGDGADETDKDIFIVEHIRKRR